MSDLCEQRTHIHSSVAVYHTFVARLYIRPHGIVLINLSQWPSLGVVTEDAWAWGGVMSGNRGRGSRTKIACVFVYFTLCVVRMYACMNRDACRTCNHNAKAVPTTVDLGTYESVEASTGFACLRSPP